MLGEAAVNGMTVLVIDDDPVIRRVVRSTLEHAANLDCRVEEAVNGLHGLDRFEQLFSAGAAIVVVVDYQLPDLTGTEVAELILTRVPDQPIVLFTGQVTIDLRDQAANAGVAVTLSKPDIAQLPDIIATLRPAVSGSGTSRRARDN